MLEQFELEKVGFSESIKLNDVFEHENEDWAVRAIGSSHIGRRYVNAGGMSGHQNDVIKAKIVAQKVGTFNISNAKTDHTDIKSTFQTSNYFNSKSGGKLARVGDIVELKDGEFYIAEEIHEIKFSFVDMIVIFSAKSIVELPEFESKKITIDKKLNKLGWKVI